MTKKEFIDAFAYRFGRQKKDTALFINQFEDFINWMLENNECINFQGLFSIGMENWNVKSKYVPGQGYINPPPRLRPFVRISPTLKAKYIRENPDGLKFVHGEVVSEDEV